MDTVYLFIIFMKVIYFCPHAELTPQIVRLKLCMSTILILLLSEILVTLKQGYYFIMRKNNFSYKNELPVLLKISHSSTHDRKNKG